MKEEGDEKMNTILERIDEELQYRETIHTIITPSEYVPMSDGLNDEGIL
jgi:hypothetical protein